MFSTQKLFGTLNSTIYTVKVETKKHVNAFLIAEIMSLYFGGRITFYLYHKQNWIKAGKKLSFLLKGKKSDFFFFTDVVKSYFFTSNQN